MNKEIINNAITAALVADAYCLGAHWVYDEDQLKALDVDWNELNTPCSMWHKGKEKGDFTHYGDHGKWLHDYVKNNKHFDIKMYGGFWTDNMQDYKGYIDSSSRETLDVLKDNPLSDTGASSHDLSIIGRIAPLLLVSSTKEEFLTHVKAFIAFTHNSDIVLKAGALFASLLYEVAEGKSITDALDSAEVDPSLQNAFDAGIASKGQDTFTTIRTFGPACGVEGGFEGVIHLLCTYDDYKEAMIENAKAGGDSSARGMIVAMIMGASGKEVPASWKEGTKGL